MCRYLICLELCWRHFPTIKLAGITAANDSWSYVEEKNIGPGRDIPDISNYVVYVSLLLCSER